MNRIYDGFSILGITAFLLVLIAPPTHAIQLNAGQTVTVPEGQTIEGSYLVAGQTITVQGRVSGDLYCAGQTVRVQGSVGGDILCAAQTVTVDGSVQGDVRVLGQELSLASTVGRNVTALVQVLTLDSRASVAGELIAGAERITLNGELGGDVMATAEEISINGRVNGDVSVNADQFSLGSGASITGNLQYTSNQKLSPAARSRVNGSVRYTTPSGPAPEEPAAQGTWGWLWWLMAWLYSLISFFVMGLLFLVLWPAGASESVRAIHQRPGTTLAWGLVTIAVPPVLALLLLITVVGAPLAVVLVLLWVCLLLLSPVMTGVAFGDWVLNRIWKGRPLRLYGALALGVAVLWLFFAVPYLGTLLYILATMLGLGGLFHSFRMLRGASRVDDAIETSPEPANDSREVEIDES